MVFGYYVEETQRHVVAEVDKEINVLSIEEKPTDSKSNCGVTGLYFYPNSVVGKAKKVKSSDRIDLEITSVNQQYPKEMDLKLQIMSRGYAWLDTGTHVAMSEATKFVKPVERRASLKIAEIEEIVWGMGYIDKQSFEKLIEGQGKSGIRKIVKH